METYSPPADNKLCSKPLPGIDDRDLAQLSILSTPSAEATFHATTVFFRDSELLPGDSTEWEDRGCLPFDYYAHPLILQNITHAPQLLYTTFVMDKRMVRD